MSVESMCARIIHQAATDYQENRPVPGFPSGRMSALTFFHSEWCRTMTDLLNVDLERYLKRIGVPVPNSTFCPCYSCRTNYKPEATTVAKKQGNYRFRPRHRHIVVWQDHEIVAVIPECTDRKRWLSAAHYLEEIRNDTELHASQSHRN